MEQAEQGQPPIIRADTDGQYRGEDQACAVSMTEEAFNRHVKAYLEKRGITKPLPGQIMAAQQAVQKVSYWHGFDNFDNDVHVRSKKKRGGHAK